jgi:cobalt/nickel transport system permease protein
MMHIPDGFLTNPVCAATAAVSAVGLAGAAALLRRGGVPSPSPAVAAVTAAGIFAGQMINFPIAQGTSGHLIGAALATALLGPAWAILVIASVLIVQCTIFGDGGLFALGANIMNMALVAVAVSQLALVTAQRAQVNRFIAVAAASWCSVVVAAAACSVELAISGVQPIAVVLPAMLKVHALIGVGEAMITVAVLAAVQGFARVPFPKKGLVGLAAGLFVAGAISPWASSSPDGLERIAEIFGFANRATLSFSSLLPDYSVPGIASGIMSTALAGVLGTLAVYIFVIALCRGSSHRFLVRSKA